VQGHEGVVFISGKYLSLIARKGVVGLRVSLGSGAGVHFNVGYNVRRCMEKEIKGRYTTNS
jgi:hypothetical protein